MQEVLIRVHGEVQGTGFRASTKSLALELLLTGWVRNSPEGTVEILAQGKKKNLEKFVAWTKHGPPFATVEKVETEWRTPQKQFPDFTIRY